MKELMRQVILCVSLKLSVNFHFLSVRWFTLALYLFAMICSVFIVALSSTFENCTFVIMNSQFTWEKYSVTCWTVRISNLPIPVIAWSKACACGHSLAGIAGLNPAGGMDICVMRCK